MVCNDDTTERTPDELIAERMARQHGVIHRRDALRLGASPKMVRNRLATGRWLEPHRAVYVAAAAPESARQRLLAAVLAGPPGTVTSHRAAAFLHAVPGFPAALPELLVARPRVRRVDIAGAIVHHTTRLPEWQSKQLDAIPTTTIARMLFDLGAVVGTARVARAVDTCLGRGSVTVPALWRVLDDLAIQGRNGTTALREVLMERGDEYVAPASELERRFLELVRRARLPVPSREVDLGDADQWIGRVEFVYRPQHVLVEIDSRLHHSSRLDFENDRSRDNRFVAEGFRVLRFTHQMLVKRPEEVERVLRRALDRAA